MRTLLKEFYLIYAKIFVFNISIWSKNKEKKKTVEVKKIFISRSVFKLAGDFF